MTRVSGAAAYQRLQRIDNQISQNANAAADRAAANMRQKRALNAQKAKDDEAARGKAYDETNMPDDAFKTTITGFDSRDDVARSFATKATEGYTNAGRLAREAYDKGDQTEYRRQLDNQKKILSQFKNFTNNEGHLAELNKQWVTMGKEGKISPVDDRWEQFMEAQARHDFEYKLDENNNPYVQMLMKDDEGNERVERIKVSDLVNGNYRPYEKVEVTGKGGLVDEMLVGFGKRKYDSETGGMIVTDQVWDNKNQKALDAKIETLVGDKRTMSSLLYQASGGTIKKMGDTDRNGENDAYTPEDEAMVSEWLTKQVLGQYDESTTRKVRPMTAEERMKEGARNRAVQRRGQDLGVEKHQKGLDNAWRIANLKKKKDGGKLSDEEKIKEVNMYAYKLAKKLHDLPESQQNDVAVKKILEEEGIEFDSGWKMRDGNQFELKDGDGNWKWADQKSIHTTANLISSQLGVDYDRKSVVVEKERKLDGKTDDSTTKLSDEEYEKILREAAGN